MKIIELFEAIPSAQQRAHTYYHGTGSDDAARSIWAGGLDPSKADPKSIKADGSNFFDYAKECHF